MIDYEEKPKKKKKHNKSKDDNKTRAKPVRNFKIIDDDIGLNSCAPNDENETMVDLLGGQDAPQIITDLKDFGQEKLKVVNKLDYFSDNKWVQVDVCENEDGDISISSESKSLFKKRGEKSTKVKTDSDSDLELPRKKVTKNDSDSDLEIPRRKKTNDDSETDMDAVPRRPKFKKEYDDDDSSPIRSRHVKEEEEVDETKVRVRKKSKFELLKEEEVKRKKEEKLMKYMEWGKGLVQKKEREEKLEDAIYEADKPLSRYKNDKDLDHLLKGQEREDDPMAEYIRNRNEDGEVKPQKLNAPKYRGPPAPPNRYGIQPGARWDGVDRSNGFEKRFYESINAKKAREEAAYKWSVEDM